MTSPIQIEELAVKIRRLEEALAANGTSTAAKDSELMRAVGAVDEITRRVFDAPVRITPEEDPEIGRWYFVVHVVTRVVGSEAVRLNRLWNRSVLDQLGDAALHFRLSLDVQ